MNEIAKNGSWEFQQTIKKKFQIWEKVQTGLAIMSEFQVHEHSCSLHIVNFQVILKNLFLQSLKTTVLANLRLYQVYHEADRGLTNINRPVFVYIFIWILAQDFVGNH